MQSYIFKHRRRQYIVYLRHSKNSSIKIQRLLRILNSQHGLLQQEILRRTVHIKHLPVLPLVPTLTVPSVTRCKQSTIVTMFRKKTLFVPSVYHGNHLESFHTYYLQLGLSARGYFLVTRVGRSQVPGSLQPRNDTQSIVL